VLACYVEGERERGREEERKRGREGGRKRGREEERKGGREGGREGERERGREGGDEGRTQTATAATSAASPFIPSNGDIVPSGDIKRGYRSVRRLKWGGVCVNRKEQ